jgi:hypothetical protein
MRDALVGSAQRYRTSLAAAQDASIRGIQQVRVVWHHRNVAQVAAFLRFPLRELAQGLKWT